MLKWTVERRDLGIWLATSKNLVHWSKYEDNALFPINDKKSSGIFVHDKKQFRLYTMDDNAVVYPPDSSSRR